MAAYEGGAEDGAAVDGAAVDALWAAITDEPLPEGVRDDPEFLAEHRSATADVALLREQLGLIGALLAGDEVAGDEVAGDEVSAADTGEGSVSEDSSAAPPDRGHPAPPGRSARPAAVSSPPSRARGSRRPPGTPRRRHPGVAAVTFGTLAVTAVAALIVGMGWLLAHNGGASMGASDSSGAKAADSGSVRGGASFGARDHLGCSRLVVEGTVADVEPLPGTTENRITLDVERYYKPDKGAAEVVVVLDEDVAPRPHKGEHVLVAVHDDPTTPTVWTTGEKAIADERAWIVKALPDSRALTCP
ncbi:hypothetical protein OG762_14745 [Streptomyces sp. NBC_01136]|uniref:hypothetical protein n=1 Tax=Streptomyces sp. NBC_01136 TaxID=2903754 RepID=UPI0038645088|nr:hypothetical protein OG762_14745 [Streptomyces sp. NBC_01136]